MTSHRGWFLTITVLSMAAAGHVQAQSITDAPEARSAVQVHKRAPSSGPSAVAQSAISSRAPIATRAMFGVPTEEAAAAAGYSPWYVPAGAGAQHGYDGSAFYPNAVQPAAHTQYELASPPPPYPGMTGSSVSMPGGKGGYDGGGCNGCTLGCESCSGGSGGSGGYGCEACGGYGCDSCQNGVVGGLLTNWLAGLLPFPEGGRCAPRWYDIQLDALYLTREEVSRTVDFASTGVNGPIALSTDSLDFDHQLGMRLTGSLQFFAGSNIELTYFGLFNWATGDYIADPTGNLFSVYSNFGLNPGGPPAGFDETDRSTLQQITYSSTIDNFEINFRKRWQGPNCRVQGSWLAGVRYVYLLEDFGYNTIGGDNPATPNPNDFLGGSNTLVTTRNSLTGFQLGGDLWSAIIPGVLIGGEAKAGVYGNYGNQSTNILASTTTPPATTFLESADINDIAFVAEASLQYIYRISPQWTLGGSYNVFYLDGVALAPENFNTSAPPNLQGASARTVTYNDNGNVLYHGFGTRLEYIW